MKTMTSFYRIFSLVAILSFFSASIVNAASVTAIVDAVNEVSNPSEGSTGADSVADNTDISGATSADSAQADCTIIDFEVWNNNVTGWNVVVGGLNASAAMIDLTGPASSTITLSNVEILTTAGSGTLGTGADGGGSSNIPTGTAAAMTADGSGNYTITSDAQTAATDGFGILVRGDFSGDDKKLRGTYSQTITLTISDN